MTHEPAIKALTLEADCLAAAARQSRDDEEKDRIARRAESLRGSIETLKKDAEARHGH